MIHSWWPCHKNVTDCISGNSHPHLWWLSVSFVLLDHSVNTAHTFDVGYLIVFIKWFYLTSGFRERFHQTSVCCCVHWLRPFRRSRTHIKGCYNVPQKSNYNIAYMPHIQPNLQVLGALMAACSWSSLHLSWYSFPRSDKMWYEQLYAFWGLKYLETERSLSPFLISRSSHLGMTESCVFFLAGYFSLFLSNKFFYHLCFCVICHGIEVGMKNASIILSGFHRGEHTSVKLFREGALILSFKDL